MCKASVFDSALWTGAVVMVVVVVEGSRVSAEQAGLQPLSSRESCGAQIQRPLDDKSGVGHLTNPS